jgi:hypothetical protein
MSQELRPKFLNFETAGALWSRAGAFDAEVRCRKERGVLARCRAETGTEWVILHQPFWLSYAVLVRAALRRPGSRQIDVCRTVLFDFGISNRDQILIC